MCVSPCTHGTSLVPPGPPPASAPADAPGAPARSPIAGEPARRPPPAARGLTFAGRIHLRAPVIVDASTTHRTATAGTDVGALASQREVQPRRVATRRCALEGELSPLSLPQAELERRNIPAPDRRARALGGQWVSPRSTSSAQLHAATNCRRIRTQPADISAVVLRNLRNLRTSLQLSYCASRLSCHVGQRGGWRCCRCRWAAWDLRHVCLHQPERAHEERRPPQRGRVQLRQCQTECSKTGTNETT